MPGRLEMTILALDTSGAACSVALWRDGAVAARRFRAMARGHAEALVPMIAEVLDAADTDMESVGRIAATTGPGSFTGLRCGLAAARGLALARDIPLVGISSLEAVAYRAAGVAEIAGHVILSALETRRADVYVQCFTPALAPLSPPAALLPEAVPETVPAAFVIVAGDAAARLEEPLRQAGLRVITAAGPELPDAADVAAIAASRPALSGDAAAAVRPLYVHRPEATVPSDGGRLRP